MGESKSPALPLGYAPIDLSGPRGTVVAQAAPATPVYRGSCAVSTGNAADFGLNQPQRPKD